ncbi:cellulose biosynthesis cyclic di-GMP-binding regulatory protein BcsB [Xenophilus arseniciresistens]|uniref:Cyclic di-GMP-binding protein n=1 Tax=Xenophilus arseniciresistens TaxID=1283306 RepID=A0AAE3N6A0_9BURK|nr:cellulose biosynthesis cyclic di-GMP-binding regulatory protein BcsB [Xenophilus arseniciresistens]MDA7415673.1 cellulose biosynthesis cyclic di-GMP-binding regulatory protein BcsB [Xenophilus arseniciresistens]
MPFSVSRVLPHGNSSRVALACLALLWSASMAQERPAAPAPGAVPLTENAAASTAPGGVREFNLTQLGINYAVQLQGVSSTVGIPFSIRADELVTQAALRLNYSYSPSLIPELSHLKVSVNDVLVATLPASAADAGKPLTRDIPIDRRLIAEFNRINIQLVGHYTRECEDPMHSSLWAKVDASSTLRLNMQALKLGNELGSLPQPFFDARDIRRARIPIVLANSSSPLLESAGILSSWLGAQADYRGAQFPVSLAALPASGHAIVLALADSQIQGLSLPAVQGPSLQVIDHPADPTAKLLLVRGRNAEELRSAASAVALNAKAFSGASALVSEFQPPQARKPYDAPRWIPTDRPVQFGELGQAEDFTVTGYMPDVVRVNFQLPPDLFTWRAAGIPIDLQYRYTPRPRPDQSTLNINVNNSFIGALPLRAAYPSGDRWWNPLTMRLMADGTAVAKREVLLPPLGLGARNQLQLHYYFEPVAGKCTPLLDNVSGTIDPRSTIDVSGLAHYIAMPELAAFANSGFPFTRLADLADTAVILPDQPSAADLETYLGLMGVIGRATGYPALRMKVGRAADAAQWADKDLLLLGSAQRQPLLNQWAQRMPVQQPGANTTQWKLGGWLDSAVQLVVGARARGDLPTAAPTMTVADDGRRAMIAGFESPLQAGRSVVAVITPEGSHASLMEALLTPARLAEIQGSLAIVRETQVDSVLGTDTYYVGKLPPITWLRWQMSRSPLFLFGVILAVALLGATAAYASLRLRARRRLHHS